MYPTIRSAIDSGCWPPSVSSWSSSVTTAKTATRTPPGASLQPSSEELVFAGEDFRDGVVGEDLADRLREQLGRRDHADHLWRPLADRDRVGHHDARQWRVAECLPSAAREDAVGGDGVDLARALVHHGLGGGGQRAASVDHVVDDHRDLAL